jgi:hypothetical protein
MQPDSAQIPAQPFGATKDITLLLLFLGTFFGDLNPNGSTIRSFNLW